MEAVRSVCSGGVKGQTYSGGVKGLKCSVGVKGLKYSGGVKGQKYRGVQSFWSSPSDPCATVGEGQQGMEGRNRCTLRSVQ